MNMAEEKLEKTENEKTVESKVKKDLAEAVKKVKDKTEGKIELEREYIIPLRKQFLKVQRYRRAKKAVKAIKQFLAKHMHVEDRDIRKVKVDIYLNNEVWYRGIKNPPTRIKVKATKKDGIVYAELVDIPDVVKWKMQREKKSSEKAKKTVKEVKELPKEEKTEIDAAKKQDEKEKELATVEAGIESQKQDARHAKHDAKAKSPQEQEFHRTSMNRH